MRTSIVVPARNEARNIGDLLRELRIRAAEAEIIVVDGESDDGTAEQAEGLCDRLVRTRANRAAQMNAGADAASGDVLWFLHADARIPMGALTRIERVLADPNIVGGFFRIRLPRRAIVYRLTDSFAHYAGILLRMRCGDHGFFCRRTVFEQIGGFPEVELMEDVDFFREMHRAGRVAILNDRLVVSPRRYEAVGPLRVSLAFGAIALLYFFRAPRTLLKSIYRRTCCQERTCPGERSASY